MSENLTTPQAMRLNERDVAWRNELLATSQQQRKHKNHIFYTCLTMCLGMLFVFVCLVCFCDRVKELITITPYAVVLITLMGIIPMFLLAILFKGVFQSIEKDDSVITKDTLEKFKDIVGIIKGVSE